MLGTWLQSSMGFPVRSCQQVVSSWMARRIISPLLVCMRSKWMVSLVGVFGWAVWNFMFLFFVYWKAIRRFVWRVPIWSVSSAVMVMVFASLLACMVVNHCFRSVPPRVYFWLS